VPVPSLLVDPTDAAQTGTAKLRAVLFVADEVRKFGWCCMAVPTIEYNMHSIAELYYNTRITVGFFPRHFF